MYECLGVANEQDVPIGCDGILVEGGVWEKHVDSKAKIYLANLPGCTEYDGVHRLAVASRLIESGVGGTIRVIVVGNRLGDGVWDGAV